MERNQNERSPQSDTMDATKRAFYERECRSRFLAAQLGVEQVGESGDDTFAHDDRIVVRKGSVGHLEREVDCDRLAPLDYLVAVVHVEDAGLAHLGGPRFEMSRARIRRLRVRR